MSGSGVILTVYKKSAYNEAQVRREFIDPQAVEVTKLSLLLSADCE